jgi:hypothetical protein
MKIKNYIITFCDAVEPWQIGIQDPATPMMEGMIFFHYYLVFFLLFLLFLSTFSSHPLEVKPSAYWVSSYSGSDVKDPFFGTNIWQVKGEQEGRKTPSVTKVPSIEKPEEGIKTEKTERSFFGQAWDEVTKTVYGEGDIKYDPKASRVWGERTQNLIDKSSDSSKSVVNVKDSDFPEELKGKG